MPRLVPFSLFISCCSSLQSVPAWSGLLYGTIGDNSHSCHPFCTFSVADLNLNLNLNLKTDKRQRAQQSTSLVSFWGFPCATKMPTVHGLQQASDLESESELDLDLGILRQAVLSYSLDKAQGQTDSPPDRQRQPDDSSLRWDHGGREQTQSRSGSS